MSDSPGFALQLPHGSTLADSQSTTIDMNAVYSFWFGRRLWMAAAGKCLQAALLLVAGVFLLTQIWSTPNLAVQIALTGGLFTIGGIAMLILSLGELLAGLSVDQMGIRARLGWLGFSVPWSNIDRWSVSDPRPKLARLPGITLWVVGSKTPYVIPAGHLNDRSRHDIHQLFRAFAGGKETA